MCPTAPSTPARTPPPALAPPTPALHLFRHQTVARQRSDPLPAMAWAGLPVLALLLLLGLSAPPPARARDRTEDFIGYKERDTRQVRAAAAVRR